MTKDSKLTLIAVGVLAVAYLYLRKKKEDLVADSESSFSNVGGARRECDQNNNYGLSPRDCRKTVRQANRFNV